MSNPVSATHFAIPIDIYQKFIESIKSEGGLTPSALANLLLSAKAVAIEVVEDTAE